jgi:hypothetical protein
MKNWLRNAGLAAAATIALAAAPQSFAGSQTEPGRTLGFGAGPVPEGVYYTNLTDYGERSTAPGATTLGVEVTDFFWSTPWKIFGANLAIDITPSFGEVGTKPNSYLSGAFNPYFAGVLGWNLGQGFGASYTAGGYVPIKSEFGGNFGTFEQRFALSYLANGWNITGRVIWGIVGTDSDTGLQTAPDYLNFDFTATKKIGKWEAGLVGFASTDLNKPFAGYSEQSQVALGGLVGYDFGPVTLRTKVTQTVSETNYGGYDTRVWTDVIIPLWTPKTGISLKD